MLFSGQAEQLLAGELILSASESVCFSGILFIIICLWPSSRVQYMWKEPIQDSMFQ